MRIRRWVSTVYQHSSKFFHAFYGVVAVIVFGIVIHTNLQHEAQEECLARNIYWEGRTEPFEAKVKIGLLTLARVFDSQWPDDICEVVFQKSQFSWTLNAELVVDHNPRDEANWQQSLHIAKELYNRPELFIFPSGWECARYYKRADNRGVSKTSQTWFDKNLVRVGKFGSHAAYAPKNGCTQKIPTY